MLFKRGSTISAAEGGCQAEVGGLLLPWSLVRRFLISVDGSVACSMASAGFAACMGGRYFSLYHLPLFISKIPISDA